MSGLLPTPYNATYNATKAFLVSLTEGMVQELAQAGEKGIKLQVVCPGYTRTGFHEAAGVSRQGVPERAWMSAAEVVDESLADLDKGRVVCIPGRQNRLLVRLMLSVPRPVRYRLLRVVGRED